MTKKQYTPVMFEPVIKNKNYMQNERVFYLQTLSNNKELTCKYSNRVHLTYGFINQIVKNKKIEFDKDRYIPLEEKDTDEDRLLALFSPENNNENAFRIEKLCCEEKENFTYV